jgi:endothelin-converting enzyme/putative endopeptidase
LHYQTVFEKNDAVKAKDLQALLIEMEPLGKGGFGANVGPDAKNSNRNVLRV